MAESAPREEIGRGLFAILKQTCVEWSDDGASRMGAALAYYAVFSITPLLLISVAVASWFFGREAAEGQLHERLQTYVGSNGATAIEALVGSAHSNHKAGVVAVTVGFVTLLFGASGVFTQ